MTLFSNLTREARFLAKQRSIIAVISIIFLLTAFAVWSGISDTQAQLNTIERLKQKDTVDRQTILSQQPDYGSAAYYGFHLTYAAPTAMTFAAIGQRDVYPWKHRIRLLAIEGQIYESDADNPELSFLGKFDFAFLVSVLLPLFVILLLHDLRASEREAGRYDLLITTATTRQRLWFSRAMVICCALAIAILTPFVIGALYSEANWRDIVIVIAIVVAHLVFWMLITLIFIATNKAAKQSSAQIASVLLSAWILFSVIIPVSSDIVLDEIVHTPKGGDIVLIQREAVNDAWDLPFSATWEPFLATHPEWKDHTQMDSLFEWKWYYAFQQVGDQQASTISQAYRQALIEKNTLAGYFALLSPSMLTQRLLSSIANTDTQASLQYEQQVRNYHKALRLFYYPLLFSKDPFTLEKLNNLPEFSTYSASQPSPKDNN